MASFYRDSSRNGYRVQVYVRGFRRKLWLGNVSKSAARAICNHLDALVLARETGTVPPAETRRWCLAVGPRIRNQLAKWGLTGQELPSQRLPSSVGEWTQHYIDSRTDWHLRSRQRMANCRRHLIGQIRPDTALAAVTIADAEAFAAWARSHFTSKSHSGKIIADARQMFGAAVKARLLADNPFDGINTAQPHIASREAYITPEAAGRLIRAACPYYAAVIASARFGGFRVPSEPQSLQWSHINWETGRIALDSPKTGRRVVPLFPELRPHLWKLHELAPDGAKWVFHRSRSPGAAGKTYRKNLLRIAQAAGVPVWPKLWMNLRASCRTDLLEEFPGHVVDSWLGHSAAVGRQHYDRIHEGHFARAACGVAGGVAPPQIAAHPRQPDTQSTQ